MFKFKLLFLKTVLAVFKAFGRGSSIAGFIDGKLKLNIIQDVDFENKPIIFVLGTNGKTTTSNILYEILAKENKVVANLKGANLESGIKTTLISALKYNKKLDADIILLEVDEKTLKGIKEHIKPTHILITNFFRDQLDRYGEIDMIINEIIESINELDAKVFLNGNDPLQVFRFEKCTSEIEYYGINKHDHVTEGTENIIEIKYCPHCITELHYNYYHYGHIGNYECKNCDFKEKDLRTSMNISFEKNNIEVRGNKIDVNVKDFPVYFYFNIVSALSVIEDLDIDYVETLDNLLNTFEFPQGRNQHIRVGEKEIYFNLAKNVVGFEETIEYLVDTYDKFSILIAFNDEHADGRDVSWIWDVKMKILASRATKVYIVGTRRYDMALKLESAEIKNLHVFDTVKEGINLALDENEGVLAVITNYTPLVELDQNIQSWVGKNA